MHATHVANASRLARGPGARSLPALLLLATVAAAQGPAPGTPSGVLPWGKVQGIVQQFETIAPPPPPLQTVLLGTFDAATGTFIWGPDLELWEVPVDLPYDDPVIAPAFELHGLTPVMVDLEPHVLGLASIGLQAGSALGGAAGGAHFKPGKPAGKQGAKPQAATQTVPGVGQRFRGHPLDKGVMRTFARAAKLALVVEVVNRAPDQALLVSVDGATVQQLADSLDVIVPPRTHHGFEVRCGERAFADSFLVERPPQLGVFTIEALPVTLVYEPPGGAGCQQTYVSVHRAGTELRSFTTTEKSATTPVETPFSTLEEYATIAEAVGGAAQSAPHPGVKAAGTAVQTAAGVLKAAFGSMTVDQQVSNTVTDTHALALEVIEGSSTSTSEGLGPGQGDVFHLLVKPTFAWLVAQDPATGAVYVSTSLLGYEGVARYSARSLREHTMAVPPAEMQDLLLALDPLAPEYTGPGSGAISSLKALFAQKQAQRLVPLDAPMVYLSGASGSFWLSHTLTSSDVHARVEVETITTKSSAGFLSYVSSAVPADEDKRVSVTQGLARTGSFSDTVEVRVDLLAASGAEGLALEVSYDRAFGTFAFRPLAVQAQSLSGTVSDGSGQPLGDEPVLLTFLDGATMQARTDAQGRFSVRPPVGAAGRIALRSGGARTTVDWSGASRSGVELRGATALANSRAKSKGGGKPPKGGAGLPDPSTVPVKASEGDTAMAIRGRPGPASSSKVAEPAEIRPDPDLRGRLGRLVVRFPEGAETSGTSIVVLGGEKQAANVYGGLEKDLMPGVYSIEVQGRRVEGVEVRSGHVTRLHVGVLRLTGSADTNFQLHRPGEAKAFFSCYGGRDIGLAPGEIEVEVGGQRAAVTIVPGQVVEF